MATTDREEFRHQYPGVHVPLHSERVTSRAVRALRDDIQVGASPDNLLLQVFRDLINGWVLSDKGIDLSMPAITENVL